MKAPGNDEEGRSRAAEFSGVFDRDKYFADGQNEDFKFPEITLESISSTGLALVRFSDKFVLLEDMSELKKQEIFFKGEKKDNI